MTVGSAKKIGTNENVSANRITEIYDHSTSVWDTKAFYPFQTSLVDYQILPLSGDFIIFGGFDEKVNIAIPIIAKFDPTKNVWNKLGNLRFSRHAFGAIEIQKQFLIMGGGDKKRTETCILTGESIKCKSREPTLNSFQLYPALMVVETDYTEHCKNFSLVQKTTLSTTKLTTTSTMKMTTTPKTGKKHQIEWSRNMYKLRASLR